MTDIERARAARARRLRRRHTIALLTVAGFVLVTFCYAFAYYEGWVGSATRASAAATCRPVVRPAPGRASFTVNVYNATDRTGLARGVAKALRDRSFRVGKVGNDPQDAVISQSAEVRYGDRSQDAAYVVASQLKGVRLTDDGRPTATVDLVLGLGYRKLVAVPPKPPPPVTSIGLNVYNTTFRTGMASAVGKQMHARGFRIGRVSNDPLRKLLLGTGEIRFGDAGAPAAKVVAQHVTGATLVHDQRTDASVDLVLGNLFTALVPRADVPPPPRPTPTPRPMITYSGC